MLHVNIHHRHFRNIRDKLQIFCVRYGLERFHNGLDDCTEIIVIVVEFHLARFELEEIKKVVDQFKKYSAAVGDAVERLLLRGGHVFFDSEQVCEADDGIERGAHVMAEARKEEVAVLKLFLLEFHLQFLSRQLCLQLGLLELHFRLAFDKLRFMDQMDVCPFQLSFRFIAFAVDDQGIEED